MKDEENKTIQEKEVQYYAAKANAWFATKLERDKTLISLSTGGIGLLVTLVTTVGASSLFILVIYLLGILSFLVCTISVVNIFNRNAVYLEKLIRNQAGPDSLLKFLDKSAYSSFILGVTFTFVLGLSAGIDKFYQSNEVEQMSEKEVSKTTTVTGNYRKRSFDGAENLAPSKPSFEGAENIGLSNTGSSQQDNPGNDSGAQSQSTDSTNK
jgi:hypothetical protein